MLHKEKFLILSAICPAIEARGRKDRDYHYDRYTHFQKALYIIITYYVTFKTNSFCIS